MTDPTAGFLGDEVGDTADGPNKRAPLDAREVEIRGTTFRFHSMMPIPAYRLLEKLRVGIGGNLLVDRPVDTPIQVMGLLLSAIDEATFEEVRRRVFDRVTFTNATRPNGDTLLGNEEMAFAELGPEHIYEVVVRGFHAALRTSFDEIISWFPNLSQTDISQFTPSISNLFSPTPSSPDGSTASD